MHGSLHNSILTESLRKLDRLGVKIIPPQVAYGKK
jgi:phosphopantothenoylcysteine decarboxylase / phosphopantothenate---cysteine ligase